MSGETARQAAAGLRRGAIGLREVLFQGIKAMATGAVMLVLMRRRSWRMAETARVHLAGSSPTGLPRHTVVIVELFKGLATPWPRTESDPHSRSTVSARPLGNTFRIRQVDRVRRLVRAYGFSALDAHQFAAQAVGSPPVGGCDTDHTCAAMIHKQWAPAPETHHGAHARLRETAATPR